MIKAFTIILVLMFLSACQTVDRGSFGSFQRSLNNKSYGYEVINDPTGNAPTSLVERFEVRPGDCGRNSDWNDCAKDRERSELSQTNPRTAIGSSYWYGWSLFVPNEYENISPVKVSLGQFHQTRSHPVWMFQQNSLGYFLDDQVTGHTRKNYLLIRDEDLRGKWHHIEIHARWSRQPDGFMKVYVNGEKKVDYKGQTAKTETYFKYGLYRTFVSRHKAYQGVEIPTQVVYFANVKRSSSREGLRPSQPN